MIVEKIKFGTILLYFIIYIIFQVVFALLYKYSLKKYEEDKNNEDSKNIKSMLYLCNKWFAFFYAVLIILQFYIRR
jgi:heme/copper-type cytochrome/quinol oxidase subunit 2